MLEKVLVANRGEISIRAFRAAYELGIRTVAVYTPEDRFSLHRQKADEAYEIGEAGHPVRAYLDADALVKTALREGADAIYPGYGFLSESAAFARGCEEAGLKFVGPSARVLELTGDKLRARRAAEEAGLSVLRASEAVENAGDAIAAAEDIGYPVFVKAAGGGGGRGSASSIGPRICPTRCGPPCARPRALSATRRYFWSRRSLGPGTSRYSYSPTAEGAGPRGR